MMTAMDKIASTPMNEIFNDTYSYGRYIAKRHQKLFQIPRVFDNAGCFEVVVWTVFKEPIGISAKQMARFRQNVKIEDNTENLVNNYRKTQPWNGRKVENVSTKKTAPAPACENSAVSHLITWSAFVVIFAHILTF